MSTIYTFLQKRKMHESHHGLMMIITAYVLSFIMLILGSDVFYNISSLAAGVNKTDEVTHELMNSTRVLPGLMDLKSKTLQDKLLNPYGLSDISITTDASSEEAVMNSDTVWLLGNAMDSNEYNSFLEKLDNISTIAKKNDEAKSKNTVDQDNSSADKNAIESLSVTKEKNSSFIMEVSEKEVIMLERIVEAEASGEDMIGKILIANVIFNRIEAEQFPDTIKEVIFQEKDGEYQFSPIENERYWSVKISKKTKEAVKRALQGEDYSKGALYFIARKRTTKRSAAWFDNNLDWLFKHGGHEFYKNK